MPVDLSLSSLPFPCGAEREYLTSIIIPVYNGREYLSACLDAIHASSRKPYEIIVVDDASTDHSAEIARSRAVEVLQLPRQSGPAAARNYGAGKAQGDILFFVDADVVVRPETIARVAADFEQNPGIVAVFGSYDDSPAAPGLVSQFRNLLHHFTHQQSRSDANSFWAGCGAIYREIFDELKGFDEDQYAKPSTEDIELGLRVRTNGYGILLDKDLQVKHLKHWGWRSWLTVDIFQRAVPWSQLILKSSFSPRDLNLQPKHRISAVLVGLLTIVMMLAVLHALSMITAVASSFLTAAFMMLMIFLLVLNQGFYSFLYKKKGLRFMISAIPLHLLYYFYSGLTFCVCWALHGLARFGIGGKRSETTV